MGKFDGVYPAGVDLRGIRVMGRAVRKNPTGQNQKLNPRRERNLRFNLEPIRA